MAAPDDTLRAAEGPAPINANAQLTDIRSQLTRFKEYTKERSVSSNDCAWLHELLSFDAISAGKVNPEYRVRVYYKVTREESTTTVEDFGTGSVALLDLKHCLASKHIRAVVLCHRDSSQVDPRILALLWIKLKLELSFMRQHFDYKEFRDEIGCPIIIRDILKEEYDTVEDYWDFGGRWNPIQLPSETCASKIRLSVDSECLSLCSRSGVVIALVRSKAVYNEIQPVPWNRERRSFHCASDLYAATVDTPPTNYELPSDSAEFSCAIVHFYARILALRCYEDYNLRHDTQPIHLNESDRISFQNHPHIIAMHHRRLELIKLKQNLSGYLGPPAPKHTCSYLTEDQYRQKLQGVLTDIEMLLSLYDNTLRIYEWHIRETDSDYKATLASEQLDEARESKATAISLGKLSNLAFLYLPINAVCAMLGMNLSIFGQGVVPLWVFFVLIILFGLLTYLPVFLPQIDERSIKLHKVAYYLAWRSIPAGFWFLAFCWTHNYHQNFEIMNSGLSQELLGYTGARTRGWMAGRNDAVFEKATWGSQAFWKRKVDRIFLVLKESNSDNELTTLTV